MSKQRRRGRSPAIDPEFAAALEGRGREGVRAGGHGEHKARQLCRQAQRALNLALAERGSDPDLDEIYVDDVTPAPGCGHLLVHVVAPAGRPLPDVLASLRREMPRLRAQTARAINRKRAPQLSFVPAMRSGGGHV